MTLSKRTIYVTGLSVGLLAILAIGHTILENSLKTSDQIVLLGNVDVRQVNLAFKVSGRIASVAVEEGDSIEAGQVVASLEREDFEDEVRLAKARVEQQEAALSELEAGTRPEEIEQARALVEQREAALELAKVTLERQEKLASQNVTSHQVHDEAQARLDEARAQLLAAQKALEVAVSGPRKEEIEQARAQLTANRASLNLAERRLSDTTLHAPNAGIILTRVHEPGAIVAAGDTICTLTLTSPVWIRTYVEEPDLGRIHAGMVAKITTDSGGAYAGQVGFISPVAEFTPKTVETRKLRTSLVYRLRIIVENPDNALKQGMPVTVTVKPDNGS